MTGDPPTHDRSARSRCGCAPSGRRRRPVAAPYHTARRLVARAPRRRGAHRSPRPGAAARGHRPRGRCLVRPAHADGEVRWLIICAALVATIVVSGAATALATGTASATATAWLRVLLADHVLGCGPALLRRFSAGDTVSRIVGGTADAGTAPVSMVTAVTAVIPPAGSVLALGLIDPWLMVAFAAGLPVLALVVRRLVRDSSDVSADYQRAQGAIAARLLDTLAGARTVAAARHPGPGTSAHTGAAGHVALLGRCLLADPGPGRRPDHDHRSGPAGHRARRGRRPARAAPHHTGRACRRDPVCRARRRVRGQHRAAQPARPRAGREQARRACSPSRAPATARTASGQVPDGCGCAA